MNDPVLPAELLIDGPTPILDDHWDQVIELDDEAPHGRWSITDEKVAAWAMAKLAEYESDERDVMDQAREWTERIRGWERARVAQPRKRVAFLRACLAEWALERRQADPKGPATFPLPTGTVKTQVRKATVDIVHAPSLIRWLKAHRPKVAAEIVETVEKVGVRQLRRHASASETLIGFEVELQCGHVADIEGPAEVGADVWCHECVMPEGREPMMPIAEILSERTAVAALIDGEPVPGLVVQPEHVIASVEVTR